MLSRKQFNEEIARMVEAGELQARYSPQLHDIVVFKKASPSMLNALVDLPMSEILAWLRNINEAPSVSSLLQ